MGRGSHFNTATTTYREKEGREHAQLRMTRDGSLALGFFDKEGKPIWPGKLLLP